MKLKATYYANSSRGWISGTTYILSTLEDKDWPGHIKVYIPDSELYIILAHWHALFRIFKDVSMIDE